MSGKSYRIWSIGMPFKKTGWPVVGSFGKDLRSVIIMEYTTWKRLCEEHPSLAAAQFEVGEFEPNSPPSKVVKDD